MGNVKFQDIVVRANTIEDRNNTSKLYYVGGEHFISGELLVEDRGIIADSTIGMAFYFGFKKGQSLFVTRNPHLKKAGMATFDGLCSEKTFVLEPRDPKTLLPEYLPLILQSERFWNYMETHKSGSVNFFVNWSTLANYEFNLPPIEEQVRIADLLWALNDVKKAHRNLLAATDELIKARFVEMFGDSASSSIPLKECCLDIRGGGTPSMQHSDYYGGDVPFIKSGDVRGDAVSSGALWLTEKALAETTAKYIPRGSVLVVTRSAALLREFRAAIAIQPVVINQDIKAFVPKTSFTSEYLLWAIKIQTQFLLTKVTTILTSHIDLKDLLELQIPSSSIEQQKAFSNFVSQVDNSKVAIQKILEQDQSLLNSLMRKYLG